jgi:TolA-binding protein
MKRVSFLFLLCLALLRLPVSAQDSTPPQGNTAASIAAREDAEDRYKRMAADLQALQTDNEALHAKISSLEQQIQSLRDAQSHTADNSGVQDELKRLALAIQEVDKKRIEDKEAIAAEIHQSVSHIESSLTSGPPPVVHAPSPTESSATEPPAAAQNGYSYTIQSGDTLGEILKAYNKDFRSKGLKSVTMKQAMEANPRVNWGRLRVGQKIIIPRPEGSQ